MGYADGRYAFGFPHVRVNDDGANIDVLDTQASDHRPLVADIVLPRGHNDD